MNPKSLASASKPRGERTRQAQWGATFLLAFVVAGCADSDPTEQVVVQWSALRQPISGFGASSAWTAPSLSGNLANQLFSAEDGIGLSLLRLRIAPDGSVGETATARQALARGVRVWASPWTPPGAWKDNGSDTNGGSLLPEHYESWARRLAATVRDLSDEGIPLLALSAQNEPDYVAEWETCRWEPEDLAKFIAEHLGPALAEHAPETTVLAPESAGWGRLRDYTDAILAHAEARAVVGIVATHGYNNVPFEYSEVAEHGLELWQTEVSDSDNPGGNAGMDSGLWVARRMHQDLTIGNVSAWHYWWLLPRTDPGAGEDTNAALIYEGALTRRAYVMGHYSRFVRPGFVRLATSTAVPRSGVLVTAFRSAEADRIVVVAVNTGRRSAALRIAVDEVRVGDVTPWVTSDEHALEALPSIPGGDGFEYDLGPRSVTTFVASVDRSRSGAQ